MDTFAKALICAKLPLRQRGLAALALDADGRRRVVTWTWRFGPVIVGLDMLCAQVNLGSVVPGRGAKAECWRRLPM